MLRARLITCVLQGEGNCSAELQPSPLDPAVGHAQYRVDVHKRPDAHSGPHRSEGSCALVLALQGDAGVSAGVRVNACCSAAKIEYALDPPASAASFHHLRRGANV